MKDPRQIDLDLGNVLRDEGIRASLEHAEDVTPEWAALALAFLRDFAASRFTFARDEVAPAAERSGRVPIPPDRRAWGGVFLRARRAKWIEKIGFVEASSPKHHKAPVTIYRSNLYTGSHA